MAQMPKRPPKKSAPKMIATEITDRRESRNGKSIDRVEDRGAVGGDSRDENNRQKAIEQMHGQGELGRRKVRGDEREETARGKRHDRTGGGEEQAHPEHGTRQKLLGAFAALLFPHPDERGHQRLIHRFGNKVHEQAGDERGGQECIHGIGAAIDGSHCDFLEGSQDLDDDTGGANRDCGAEDGAIDA